MILTPKRRWFTIAIPVLVLAVGILLFVWHPGSPSREVTIIGNLSHFDETAIGEAISASDQLISKRILSIRVRSPDIVEVSTGEQRGPLDGSGDHVTLQRVDGTWTIIEVAFWVS